jgi:hypothetical protein
MSLPHTENAVSYVVPCDQDELRMFDGGSPDEFIPFATVLVQIGCEQ